MMKSISGIVLAILVWGMPGIAQAMQYYTFEGAVSSDNLSSTVDFQDQYFSAVFAVDYDGVGSSTDSAGVKTEYSDFTEVNGLTTATSDYFYAELVSTNFRQMAGMVSVHETYGNDITVHFSKPGFERTMINSTLMGTSFDGATFGDSTSSFRVMIMGAGGLFKNCVLGDTFSVSLDSTLSGEAPIHGTEFTDMAAGQLALTSISDTMPAATPIPGAVWLLGSGLVGLIGLTSRRQKVA